LPNIEAQRYLMAVAHKVTVMHPLKEKWAESAVNY